MAVQRLSFRRDHTLVCCERKLVGHAGYSARVLQINSDRIFASDCHGIFINSRPDFLGLFPSTGHGVIFHVDLVSGADLQQLGA
jgi:hypothetical protein